MMPGGTFKNKEFRLGMIEFSSGVDPLTQEILFDPQTSGGLMICVKREQAVRVCAQVRVRHNTQGRCLNAGPGMVTEKLKRPPALWSMILLFEARKSAESPHRH